MSALAPSGLGPIARTFGSIALWMIGVLFFLVASGRLSGFLGGVFDGRPVNLVISENLLRPFPSIVLVLGLVVVALFFIALQIAKFGPAVWRLLVLSGVLLPILISAVAFFNLLAWADRRGILYFGFEYGLSLVIILIFSILAAIGVLFSMVVRRYVRHEADFSSQVLTSAFLYADAGILIGSAHFVVNMLF